MRQSFFAFLERLFDAIADIIHVRPLLLCPRLLKFAHIHICRGIAVSSLSLLCFGQLLTIVDLVGYYVFSLKQSVEVFN